MTDLVTRDAKPRLHPRPASGWVNDPHAGLRLGETFHLFCQWNPASTRHENIHWAHLSSTDLLHWDVHAPALSPTPGGPDADGCWSGCAVRDGDELVLVYTGFLADEQLQSICLARSTDAVTWVKDARNPVVPSPPPGLDVVEFRDPFVWRTEPTSGGGWAALVGCALADGTAAALLYRSEDLSRWDYRGVFCDSRHPLLAGAGTGVAWECPQLLVDGDRALLVVSAWPREPSHAVAISGRLAGERFEPTAVRRLDAGPDFYAPALARDADGRSLLWGWSWEARPGEHSAAQGWAGALTFPRTLRIDQDGRVQVAPAAEVDRLRREPLRLLTSAEGESESGLRLLHEDPGETFEVLARLDPAPGGAGVLRLLADPAGREHVDVGVRRAADGALTAYVDRDRASLDRTATGGVHEARLDPGAGPVRLRVLVDHSLLEVFVDDLVTFTVRVYPQLAGSTGLLLGWTEAGGAADELAGWRLAL
ncbi:MAG: glycoside hydrolase family 32 protein [Motilibacteraceae bacterium]